LQQSDNVLLTPPLKKAETPNEKDLQKVEITAVPLPLEIPASGYPQAKREATAPHPKHETPAPAGPAGSVTDYRPKSRELPDSMPRKLPIDRDTAMENLTELTLEACAAYYDGDVVRVVGEAVSTNGRTIPEYREIQVSVYDQDGDILGRSYTNWIAFQVRQSFEISVTELPGIPARVRVFPSKG
jgi:hypothetical protein